MNPATLRRIVCFRAETVPNPNPGVKLVCFRVETVPNPNLMAHAVQPTANAEYGLPITTYC